mmetsp:Transcript_10043/g.16151  ORF Transcript_10043/g.16151 Transcript_10043/m.16151 type:complete len:201 (-) Transcript_10043:1881-2483(-)
MLQIHLHERNVDCIARILPIDVVIMPAECLQIVVAGNEELSQYFGALQHDNLVIDTSALLEMNELVASRLHHEIVNDQRLQCVHDVCVAHQVEAVCEVVLFPMDNRVQLESAQIALLFEQPLERMLGEEIKGKVVKRDVQLLDVAHIDSTAVVEAFVVIAPTIVSRVGFAQNLQFVDELKRLPLQVVCDGQQTFQVAHTR